MPEDEDARWERMERNMEFIVEHQADFTVKHAQAQERQAQAEERHNREMAAIRRDLGRAVHFAVREARNERVRRKQMDSKLAAAQLVTEEKLQLVGEKLDGLIDAL